MKKGLSTKKSLLKLRELPAENATTDALTIPVSLAIQVDVVMVMLCAHMASFLAGAALLDILATIRTPNIAALILGTQIIQETTLCALLETESPTLAAIRVED